jgi:hypothetical protein
VTNPLVVAVDASPPETDPDIPVLLDAGVAGGAPPYDVTWSSSLETFGVGLSWSFQTSVPGNYTVTAYVVDALGEVASFSRTIRVDPAPSAQLAGTVPIVDVGTPLRVDINVTGGVPPFVGSLHVDPVGSDLSLAFPVAGAYPTLVSADLPGPLWGYLSVTDAVGGRATVAASLGTVCASPTVAIIPQVDRTETGAPFHLLAVVNGGTPPVGWTVLSSLPVSNASSANGTVLGSSAVSWDAEFSQPGNATISFEVRDADGVSGSAAVSIGVAPPLGPVLTVATVAPVVGGALVLNATVRGGVAPYDFTFSLSDGEIGTGNISGPGPMTWTASPTSNGSLTIELRVTDGLDRSVTVDATVLVSPATAGAPGMPAEGMPASAGSYGWLVGILGGLVAVGAMVGGWALRWRRRAPPTIASSDSSGALGEVREILRDSDGLERETLGLLAEEAGLSREAAEQAVDRWIRAGRVVVRPSPSGGDLLRWSAREDGPESGTEEP